MRAALVVINAGSSSIKFALYDTEPLAPLMRGVIDDIGGHARLVIKKDVENRMNGCGEAPAAGDHSDLMAWLLGLIEKRFADLRVTIAGHRVVHGGPQFDGPVRINAQIIEQLQQYSPMAPNHQPHNLNAIRAVARAWPGVVQVACFDTAFHRSQPRLAQLFALPRHLSDEGILRYGFHGISYQYITNILASVAPHIANGRVIIAHLGHGASMCAIHNGRSVATTMGFTAMDGLMMGKRCGDLDPGIVLYLMQQKAMSAPEVNRLLRKQSGLLGVSGISSDMRDLIGDDGAHAREAIDLFCYRAARQAGSLIAALGGLDAFVFTAGIGANSPLIRELIVARMGFAGLAIDEKANERGDTVISAPGAKPEILVIPTNEELMIARSAASFQE